MVHITHAIIAALTLLPLFASSQSFATIFEPVGPFPTDTPVPQPVLHAIGTGLSDTTFEALVTDTAVETGTFVIAQNQYSVYVSKSRGVIERKRCSIGETVGSGNRAACVYEVDAPQTTKLRTVTGTARYLVLTVGTPGTPHIGPTAMAQDSGQPGGSIALEKLSADTGDAPSIDNAAASKEGRGILGRIAVIIVAVFVGVMLVF